jgi:hypothetical protein
LWLESPEEHLPTSIAGVLRLRATGRPLSDGSARRFAQDDAFSGGVEKHFQEGTAEPQIPPLRYAPVEMTSLFGNAKRRFQDEFVISTGA